MRGRFSTRPQKSHILAHDELKFSTQPRFDRGYVDLAVPLGRVGIADREQGARDMDRHVQRRAGDQVLVVEVASVNAGRSAADAAQGGIRRNTPSAKEWLVDRHDNTPAYPRGLCLPVVRGIPP